MKNEILKKAIPHFIAIAIFLIVSVLFCKPVLDGNELSQHDIRSWKGMAENSFKYKDSAGHFPLWNPNLFSGMPNYQVAMDGKNVMPDMVKVFSLWMPKPINFFLAACICFYILALVLRARPIIAMFGGLAFAFATYNPVIISVGHESKMWAIAFMPLLFAGLIATFEKKYWLGLALTTFGIYQQIGVNHFQITYYAILIAEAITICYLVKWIRQKDWKQIGMAAGISVVAALIGIGGNALVLKTTAEYARYTIRGGKDIEIKGDTVTKVAKEGLDTDYAFEYSLGKSEILTLAMPNAFGGRSGETLKENSKVVDKMVNRGIPEQSAVQFATTQLPRYWGGIDGAAGTAGPPYLGTITCLLALIGFVLYKGPLRWGMLVMSVLAALMAYGKYLPGFNEFLFNSLPLYNKFRAPTMALVITQITFPVMAVLTLHYLMFRERSQELLKADFKKILIAVGSLIGLLLVMYVAMDYSSPTDKYLLEAKLDESGTNDLNRLILSGMKADRKAMFLAGIGRTLLFAAIVVGLLYMYARKAIKALPLVISLLVISTIDLFATGKHYLNEDNYVAADSFEATFIPNSANTEILRDKDPNFRVFNRIGNPYTESTTSYYHKSIGGYHPAKLRIYQDVIERYLSIPDQQVLDMLNTKYEIRQDQQTGQPIALRNPGAFGNCWLVKNVKIVDNRVDAIQALGTTNLRDTAIVDQSFSKLVNQPQWDSSSSIVMTKFDNDAIEYKALCNGPQFAVFSEIYYPKGWNAFIDGKQVDYVNANYLLRGLSIPAGSHTIRFAFEPESVKSGNNIALISSILIAIVLVLGLYMAWRQSRKAG